MELKIESFSSSEDLSGLKGGKSERIITKKYMLAQKMAEKNGEFQRFKSKQKVLIDKHQLTTSGASISGITMAKESKVNYSRTKLLLSNSSKGKAVIKWDNEVEHLSERIKILEEETKSMKETFSVCIEEITTLMKEIHEQFHLIIDSSLQVVQDGKTGISLSEILCPEPNPFLVTRDIRATANDMLRLQEPVKAIKLLSDA